MIRIEKEVQRKCALRANPQPPNTCPVGEGKTGAAVLGRVVRHEFIGKTVTVAKVCRFQRVDTQLFFQVEWRQLDEPVFRRALRYRERQRLSAVADLRLPRANHQETDIYI